MMASQEVRNATPVLAMDGPVLVFGGCYSNLEATQELLRRAARLGIPPGRTICTGDVVAYGADAAATADLVRWSGIHVVMGNCEESLGYDAEDCGCGFAEGSACEMLSVAWYAHARTQVGAADKAWMRELPRRIDIILDGRRLAVVHGGMQSINAFLFASTDAATLGREIALSGCDGVIAGHCGVPFSRVVAGRLWHNSGAIGMPANDGTPRAWHSLLTPVPGGLAVEHQALSYDHATAASKMRRAGLPEGYAAALETGLWPSCDILPACERAQRGRPIAPDRLLWANGGA